MNNRRRFLLGHAAAIPALATVTHADAASGFDIRPMREPPGPSASHFPNVPVVTSTGEEYLWYDDIVRRARVAINFFSFENDEKYAVTDNLLKAYRLACAKGIDRVTMISIAIDSPPWQTLTEYVSNKGVDHRWLFVTGAPRNIDLIRSFLFIRPRGTHHAHGPGHSHALAVARYGNESLARWASYPVHSSAESIVRRFTWI